MTTVTQAVERRQAGPVTVMMTSKKQFAAVLPKSVDVDAFLGTMAGALYSNADLMRAAQSSPDSLYTALMRCAALGHMPGTDEFYLTPRKDHGVPKVLGIEGYRGIVERMYRSGAVAKVVVREVCAGDRFRYVEGVDLKPVHSFGGEGTTGADFFGEHGSRDRGEMVGVYAYAELTTGAVSRVVLLSRADVFAARDSGGYRPDDKYTPWNRMDGGESHPEFKGRSMWWKTAARRLEPWVPTSAEYRREMLRASSAATEAATTRFAEPASNGQAPSEQVFDAELVDESAVPTPAPGAGAATSTTAGNAGGQTAPASTSPDRKTRAGQPASPKQVQELNELLARLPLGVPDERAADEKTLLDWLGGGDYTATRSQVTTVFSMLQSFLDAAGGDTEAAVTAIWTRYHEVNDRASGQEPSSG